MKDGPQVEVIDFDDTEITFDISEVFVRGDNSGGVQGLGVSTGADDVDSIKPSFGVDLVLITTVVERGLGDLADEVLAILSLFTILPTAR